MNASLSKATILRLAFLGWLTALVLCWLTIAPVLADVQLASAPIVYKDALPTLQRAGIPLRLPTVLIYPSAHGAYGATLDFADERGYSLTIGTRYPCGGTACAEAYVEGQPVGSLPPLAQMFAPPTPPTDPDVTPLEPLRSQETADWVSLANGTKAYFEPWLSYVSPGFAHLSWDEGSNRYSIATKFGFRDALVQMANTAIEQR